MDDDPAYIRARLQQVRDFLDKHGFEVLVTKALPGTPVKEVKPGLYLTYTSGGPVVGTVLFGDLEQLEDSGHGPEGPEEGAEAGEDVPARSGRNPLTR